MAEPRHQAIGDDLAAATGEAFEEATVNDIDIHIENARLVNRATQQIRATESGARVHFRSGEMEPARLAERALAIEGKVRVDDIRRGTLDDDARTKLAAAGSRLEQRMPGLGVIDADELLGIDEDPRRYADGDLVIIDPIQALARGARPLDEDMAVAARGIA